MAVCYPPLSGGQDSALRVMVSPPEFLRPCGSKRQSRARSGQGWSERAQTAIAFSIHFFSKRNEPKKILLSPNPFLHIKGLNTKSCSTPSTFLPFGIAGHAMIFPTSPLSPPLAKGLTRRKKKPRKALGLRGNYLTKGQTPCDINLHICCDRMRHS